MHDSNNKIHKSPFTWMKITQKQNSQVSSFRFHKQTVSRFQNNKTPTLCKFRKFMQTSLCKNSAISFQSRIVSHHLVRSNWIQKHIYRSYPTGYRSEIYMNCTANSLMRYSMRPCPSTSSCFKGPYQRYSIGFIFWSMPPSTFWR